MSSSSLSSAAVIGLATLGGSMLISRSMYIAGLRQLSGDHKRFLKDIREKTRFYRMIPYILILLYLIVRYAAPHANLLNVLFLWTSYNIFLWAKMRWMMRAFRNSYMPVGFQTNWVFAQVIGYTGLVSSLLILFKGNTL